MQNKISIRHKSINLFFFSKFFLQVAYKKRVSIQYVAIRNAISNQRQLEGMTFDIALQRTYRKMSLQRMHKKYWNSSIARRKSAYFIIGAPRMVVLLFLFLRSNLLNAKSRAYSFHTLLSSSLHIRFFQDFPYGSLVVESKRLAIYTMIFSFHPGDAIYLFFIIIHINSIFERNVTYFNIKLYNNLDTRN